MKSSNEYCRWLVMTGLKETHDIILGPAIIYQEKVNHYEELLELYTLELFLQLNPTAIDDLTIKKSESK